MAKPGATASIVAVAILTYLHIVIGEMVSKAMALQHAATTAIWVAPTIIASFSYG